VDRVISHPPYSPDCNPVKNLFGALSKKIKKNRQIFATQDLLWQEIQNQWQKLGLEISTIQSLADSMPDHYQEVIRHSLLTQIILLQLYLLNSFC
jgi:DNA-binding transcriptional MerR regulator